MTTEWMKVYFDLNGGRFNVHFADDAPETWIDRYQALAGLIRRDRFEELRKAETGVFRKVPFDCTISVTDEEIRTTVPSMAANAILQVVRRWMMQQLQNKVPTKRDDDDPSIEVKSDGLVQPGPDSRNQVSERSGLEELRRDADASDDGEEEEEVDETGLVDESEFDQVLVPEGGSTEDEAQDKGSGRD